MPHAELIFTSPAAGMQLRSQVIVAKPKKLSSRLLMRRFTVTALWDTGSVTSGITRIIAEKMGLEARERTILAPTAGNVAVYKDIVLLDLMINGCVIPVKVAIVDTIPGENNDFLIGMDIIRYGELQISTDNQRRVFNVRFKPFPGLFRPVEEIFK